MAKELVEYSARLQAAVDKILINPAFSVQGWRRIRGRSTLTEQVGSGGGAEEPETVLCKVTGQSGIGYSVDFYANGRESPSTGSGVLFATELALVGTLPEGSWILGHKTAVQITGGGES